MRIERRARERIIIGAGVLGCNMAHNFWKAGKDVTLLVRGRWGETIREKGLVIKHKFSLRNSCDRIPVIGELAAEDVYDVVFVCLRYTQLSSIMETLKNNKSKNIVFIGNNMNAKGTAKALPEKNVMFGFASSAGHRESDCVVSIDLKKIKNDKVFIYKIIDANAECYSAVEALDHELFPKGEEDYRSLEYRKMCYRFYWLPILLARRVQKDANK